MIANQKYRISALVKKYSDYIRHPIKMEFITQKPIEDKEGEYEDVTEKPIKSPLGLFSFALHPVNPDTKIIPEAAKASIFCLLINIILLKLL